MKLVSGPPQPFVGLALMAITGIVVAEILPVRSTALAPAAIIVAACILILACWPRLTGAYLVVAAGFFLLHKFATTNTEGQQLANNLGDRARTVTAVGCVITEPKIAPSEFATFLLRLNSIEFEGRNQSTHAVWQVRWKGTPEFGDELKLFGTAEPIAAPRNPGEFDMRAYLARHDVRRSLIVRYPENCHLLQSGSRFSLLRTAARSREWMQRQLSRDLEDSPDVIGLICGTALGLRHQTRDDIEEPFQQTGTLHLFAV